MQRLKFDTMSCVGQKLERLERLGFPRKSFSHWNNRANCLGMLGDNLRFQVL